MGRAEHDAAGRFRSFVQVINKVDGPFQPVDEEIASILTSQAGVCLRNASAYRSQATVQVRRGRGDAGTQARTVPHE